MAKTFNKLKDPRLALADKLSFGKLKGCRVCDVIKDHYEYLIWAEKQGYVKFQDIVVETIQEIAGYKKWQPSEEESPNPHKYEYLFESATRQQEDWYDDIPY